MTAADDAYKAAEVEIARVKEAGETQLTLVSDPYRALTTLPPQIAELKWLEQLYLDETQVAEIVPVAGLKALQRLTLYEAPVADIGPVAGLEKLQHLELDRTQVVDLRPILRCPALGTGDFGGVWYADTPACAEDAELARLSAIADRTKRLDQTLAYLRTLPPWPDTLVREKSPSDEPLASEQAEVASKDAARKAAVHIEFLLSHAAATQTQADQLAAQIRSALRDVPAEPNTNRLPAVLQSAADVASILDRIASVDLETQSSTSEADLRREIARLEDEVAELTAHLTNETRAREAAEALANANGFWASAKKGGGLAVGATSVAAVTLSVPAAAVYFLGVENPVVQAFLTVVGKLPK